MREPGPMRPTVTRKRAAGRVSVLLMAIGLGASGVPLVGCVTEPAQEDRPEEVHPTPRWAHSAAVVNGKIYVMGGVGADNELISSVEVYDPVNGTWGVGADIPTARALFGASTVGSKIYALGGTTMGLDGLAVVEAYDPATDTWTRRADMPTPRNSLSAVAVGGKIYAIGGWALDRPEDGWESVDLTSVAAFSTVEVYDPETDAWATGKDIPTPRSTMTATAFGGKIYAIGGGVRRGEQDVAVSLMEMYDTATDRWAAAPDMPTPRFVPSSGVVNGRIYVAGGATSQGPASSQEERMRNRRPLSAVEVYDPATGRWTTGADLAEPRGWLSASTVNGKLYVIGGRSLAPDGGIVEVHGAIPGLEVYTPAQ